MPSAPLPCGSWWHWSRSEEDDDGTARGASHDDLGDGAGQREHRAASGDLKRFAVETVAGLAPLSAGAEARGRGRPRELPSLCLWTGLLLCVLGGLESYRAVWRRLLEGRVWHYPRFPLGDEAVYRRLDREGTGPLEHLFTQVSTVLAHRLAPYALSNLAPFAAMVVALDQTSLDQVARLLPALAALPVGDSGLLPGQVAGLFDLRRQEWHLLRLEIAGCAGVDPFDVSMPLLVQYAPRYAAEGRDPIAVFVECGRALAFIRPSRRTVIHAPTIPDPALIPLPPGTPLQRTPRYGHPTCPPRRRSKTPHY